MLKKRKSKLERLREAAEAATAEFDANRRELNAVIKRAKELAKELRDPETPPARRMAIREEIRMLQVQEVELRQREETLSQKAMKATQRYREAQRRLCEAQRIINVIENPPPWGLGKYSPQQIGEFKRKAEQTIQELTNV